jgi:hypothetical protein
VFCCPCLRDRSFPANVEAISAGWLTTALRKEGVLPPSSTVTSVTFTRIGDSEKGMSSDLAFLALEIEGDAGSCPSKMVAKFPLPSFEKRVLFKLTNMAGREAGLLRFAGSLPDDRRIRVPTMYYFGLDHGSQLFLILMEDLRDGGGKAGSQMVGCSEDEARRVLRLLARLHASCWDAVGAGSEVRSFAPRMDDPDQSFLTAVIADAWPNFLKWGRFQKLAGLEDVVACGQEIRDAGSAALAALTCPPMTLVHGDSHAENFLFEPDGGVVALDFQLCMVGQAPFDVANFLVMSLQPDVYAAKAGELALFYYGQLKEELGKLGKSPGSLTEEECLRRYDAGLVYTFLLEFIGQGTMGDAELKNQVVNAKRAEIFNRLIRALKEVEAKTGVRATLFLNKRKSIGGGSNAAAGELSEVEVEV